MEKGSIVGSIDTAQVVLYVFWVFFAGLIFYLRREDKREGYPLVSDRGGGVSVVGFPVPPSPKIFRLAHGHGDVMAPATRAEPPLNNVRPVAPWPGAPLEPIGNPMLDAIGPGAYALRSDTPDLTVDGEVKIVPMRAAPSFFVANGDPDPARHDRHRGRPRRRRHDPRRLDRQVRDHHPLLRGRDRRAASASCCRPTSRASTATATKCG